MGDNVGATALHIAAQKGHIDVTEYSDQSRS